MGAESSMICLATLHGSVGHALVPGSEAETESESSGIATEARFKKKARYGSVREAVIPIRKRNVFDESNFGIIKFLFCI